VKRLLFTLMLGLNLLETPAIASEEPPFTVHFAKDELEVRD